MNIEKRSTLVSRDRVEQTRLNLNVSVFAFMHPRKPSTASTSTSWSRSTTSQSISTLTSASTKWQEKIFHRLVEILQQNVNENNDVIYYIRLTYGEIVWIQ